jgi:heat shock protein HslJ
MAAMQARHAFSALLFAALAQGCASPDPAAAEHATQLRRLQHGQWRVEAIDGQALAAGVSATLRFAADGSLSGQAGCNRFVGHYQVLGDRLSTGGLAPVEELQVGALATTRMACPPATMAVERRLLGVLERVNAFAVPDDGRLELQAPGGHLIAARSDR